MLIIDGNSLVHRAYWASVHSGARTLYKGTDITGTKAFIKMFEKVLKIFSDTETIVVFDSKTPSWRKVALKDYKANREKAPDFLKKQFTYVKEFLKSLNVPYVEHEGAEGDDLIGTICKMYPEKNKSILTGDHDLLQLIDDKTDVYLTVKGVGELEKMNVGRLLEKEGLAPSQIPDFKAIAGDKSDNISGVRSIGEKTAKSLLDVYGSVEGIYKNIDKINKINLKKHLIEDKEKCLLFKKVCTINCSVDLEKESIDELLNSTLDLDGRQKYYKKYRI